MSYFYSHRLYCGEIMLHTVNFKSRIRKYKVSKNIIVLWDLFQVVSKWLKHTSILNKGKINTEFEMFFYVRCSIWSLKVIFDSKITCKSRMWSTISSAVSWSSYVVRGIWDLSNLIEKHFSELHCRPFSSHYLTSELISFWRSWASCGDFMT